MNDEFLGYDFDMLEEARSTRQFKRVGKNLKSQFRCMHGEKAGRLVSSPDKCGIKKDAGRVRRSKAAARYKKAQKARKSSRTKKQSFSRKVVKFNDYMSGKLNQK